jgi:hypothetical protein
VEASKCVVTIEGQQLETEFEMQLLLGIGCPLIVMSSDSVVLDLPNKTDEIQDTSVHVVLTFIILHC